MLLRVSWLLVLITRSKARDGGARGLRKVERACQTLLKRSFGLACPPCQPQHNSPGILGFRVCFNRSEKLFTRCDADLRIALLVEIILALICCNQLNSQSRVSHPHRYSNWKQTAVLAITRRRVSPILPT